MGNDKASQVVRDSTIRTGRIQVTTTNPELKDKIRLDLGPNEPVNWFIQFNIALDPASVTHKTARVMETDGTILATDITYEPSRNLVVILPLDTYEDNRYYILTIKKKVKSALGQHLKRDINIMFKLFENKISEYKILPPNVVLPKPKPRKKTSPHGQSVTKFYSFMNEQKFKETPLDKLMYGPIKLNWLAIAGVGLALLLTVGSLVVNIFMFTAVMLAVLAASVVFLFISTMKAGNYSSILYNMGARDFNRGDYSAAKRKIMRAFELDPTNEMAEYALGKLSFYD